MEIVIAADTKMKKMAEESAGYAQQLGYSVRLFDLDSSDFSEEISNLPQGQTIDGITYTPKSQYKPFLMKHALITTKEDLIVYLDADAFILDYIDEIKKTKFDVGLTVRRDYEAHMDKFSHINGHFNAGVLFFRRTFGAKKFVSWWCEEMQLTKSGSDQEALHRIVLGYTGSSIKFATFPTDIYNYYYFNEGVPKTAKILHFKGQWKKHWKKYVKERSSHTSLMM